MEVSQKEISPNSNLYRFDSTDVSQTARLVTGAEREELIKRVRDTFMPTRDSFERMTQKNLEFCDCYTNYQITTPMPQSIFGDSFGYDMQKSIANHMRDYYADRMSDDELEQYFNECCAEMRKYRAGQHQSSGNVDADNRQIVSGVYEIFAKEKLGATANGIAGKWGIGSINTEEIEKNSDLTLDGGFDFNSGWNFTYRNQAGRASMADEIMKDFEEQTGNVKGYSAFMKQLSIFTGWYSWSTGINNRFGNYIPDDSARWQYG